MPDFEEFFRIATGFDPYAYQRELGRTGVLPSVLEIPTGAGKTQALILAWLFARRTRPGVPRRLVYALPMRSLVEQTCRVAIALRERLGLDRDSLPVRVLMGGEAAADWRERPEAEQIVIGTIDMLLSRALNRGYGESRFQWPVSFGLLNADCRWVFDEVQLMGPARVTSAQLDGLRCKLGAAGVCETIWASATVDLESLRTVDRPEVGSRLGLPASDLAGPLGERLRARKLVERVDLSAAKAVQVPAAIARAVGEAHAPGTRTIVVLNTVERAIETRLALRRLGGSWGLELLHSRFRPPERAARLAAALDPELPAGGRIVVSTQVIEAGVDVSSALLASETAPFSSLVQRLGRCNRSAEHPEARFMWLDLGDPRGAAGSMAPPYDPDDLEASRAALFGLVGSSASPETLREMSVVEVRPEMAVLRRRDLLDLFDTGPDLSGLDVDVAPFIRPDDERSVTVFFRELTDESTIETQPAPAREELVQVPVGDVGKLTAYAHDYVEGVWRRTARGEPHPGQTVMLDVHAGGYDIALGWAPRHAHGPVPVLAVADGRPPEAIGSDDRSVARRWVSLREHLADAAAAAEALADLVGEGDLPDGAIDGLVSAAALHDLGKAHPAFQEMLQRTALESERAVVEAGVWAKSAHAGGRHVRPHFRHELASALALIAFDGFPGDGLVDGDLVRYLVASHHGRVRVSIRPAPGEQPAADGAARVLGVQDGDVLPGCETPLGATPECVLSLAAMELGGSGSAPSWTAAACALRDRPDLGPFRLAYLEALLRIADWRASGA